MKTTEEKLLDLGKWAILSGQISGYFPLSIAKDRAQGRFLHFRAAHSVSIVSLGLFIIILLWLVLFLVNFSDILKQQSYLFQSPFLGMTHSFSVFLSGITILLLKTTIATQIPGFARFWQKSVETFETFELTKGNRIPSSKIINLDAAEFQSIFKETRFRALAYIVLSVIQLSMFDLRETLTTLITKGGQIPVSNLLFLICSLFQILATLTHHGHPILIIFFLKLYKTCFEVIEGKLKKLNDSDRKHGQPPTLFDLESSMATGAFIIPSQNIMQSVPSPKSHLENGRVQNIDKELTQIIDVVYALEAEISGFNKIFNFRTTLEFLYQTLFL